MLRKTNRSVPEGRYRNSSTCNLLFPHEEAAGEGGDGGGGGADAGFDFEPGGEGEGVGEVDVVAVDDGSGLDGAADDGVLEEADGEVAEVLAAADAFAAGGEGAEAAGDAFARFEVAFGDGGDADFRDGAVVEEGAFFVGDAVDGFADFEVAEVVGALDDVEGAGAHFEVLEGGGVDGVVGGGDEDAAGAFGGDGVVGDGAAEGVGVFGEDVGGLAEGVGAGAGEATGGMVAWRPLATRACSMWTLVPSVKAVTWSREMPCLAAQCSISSTVGWRFMKRLVLP